MQSAKISFSMLNRFANCLLFAIAAASHVAGATTAENWNQFRGPTEDGVVGGSRLPFEWGPTTNILWKVKVPGAGWSSPIVWGNKIFLTTAETANQTKPDPKFIAPDAGPKAAADVSYRQKVLCLDPANGKTIWERVARERLPSHRRPINSTYATETPATDGGCVIAYFGMAGVYCYDLLGNLLWTRELGDYPTMDELGTGSSPILYGDKVFIQCDNEENSFLAALDKKTGHDVWRVARDEQTNWSTPYIWKNKIRTELVTAGGRQVRSYDPDSGKILWSMTASGRTATTPVGNADMLFVDSYDRPTGIRGVFAAIRTGASGDISLQPDQSSNAYVAWSIPIKNGRVSSPALCRECVYVFAVFAGIIRCYDANTGKEHYQKRIPGAAAGITASSLATADKIYCVDQRGRTHIIEAGSEFKVAKVNKLNEEMCWASPAVAGNVLLIRTTEHLYAIGQK
jgi:outer membrane protein assembly factor BamB